MGGCTLRPRNTAKWAQTERGLLRQFTERVRRPSSGRHPYMVSGRRAFPPLGLHGLYLSSPCLLLLPMHEHMQRCACGSGSCHSANLLSRRSPTCGAVPYLSYSGLPLTSFFLKHLNMYLALQTHGHLLPIWVCVHVSRLHVS